MTDFKDLPHLKYDHEKPEYRIDPMKPLIEQRISELRRQHDDNVMKAVADVGIVVDKPRLIRALTDAKAFYEEGYQAAMNRADVVEVVRCKGCKYYDNDQCYHNRHEHHSQHVYQNDDDFCSYGVIKGEGEC